VLLARWAGQEVERVRGPGCGAVAERDSPQAVDRDRSAVAGTELALVDPLAPALGIRADPSVPDVSDQEVASEDAEIGRRERETPWSIQRRILLAAVYDARDELAVGRELSPVVGRALMHAVHGCTPRYMSALLVRVQACSGREQWGASTQPAAARRCAAAPRGVLPAKRQSRGWCVDGALEEAPVSVAVRRNRDSRHLATDCRRWRHARQRRARHSGSFRPKWTSGMSRPTIRSTRTATGPAQQRPSNGSFSRPRRQGRPSVRSVRVNRGLCCAASYAWVSPIVWPRT
jgi:hypothetical protein